MVYKRNTRQHWDPSRDWKKFMGKQAIVFMIISALYNILDRRDEVSRCINKRLRNFVHLVQTQGFRGVNSFL